MDGLSMLFAILTVVGLSTVFVWAIAKDRRTRRETTQRWKDTIDGLADKVGVLGDDMGMIGVNTRTHTLHICLPSGYRCVEAAKILNAGVQSDVRTTYNTRGRTTGTTFGSYGVALGRSQTTVQNQVVGSYLVLELDDYDCPTLVVPFAHPTDADSWCGVVRTMLHRARTAPATPPQEEAPPKPEQMIERFLQSSASATDTALRDPSLVIWRCLCGKSVDVAESNCRCGRVRGARY